jgi:predicted nucleic acid-binding protein
VTSCVLDTDVVIGALDREDAHHARARTLLLGLLEEGTALYMSVINYAEALVKPAELEDTLQLAIGALATLGIQIHSPDAAIGRDAASLRSLNISLADGFALATARRLDARVASFDTRVRNAARESGLPIA